MFFSFLKRKPKKEICNIKDTGLRRSFSRRKFFVLTIFFIILFIISGESKCHAAFKMTDQEKQQFSQMIKNNSKLPDSSKTDSNINELIKVNENKYDNFNAVKDSYNDTRSGDPMADSVAPSIGADAAGESWLAKAIYTAVIGVLQIIMWLCKELVFVAAHILDKTLDPSLYNLVNQPAITTGWAAVRDVCNLFFLLVLLFIAFCTILQIEKYHLKKTLLTLVLMALLINFSKPIAVFIFDGSQLLMNFFLSALKGDNGPSASIAKISEVAKVVYSETKYFENQADTPTIAVQFLFSTIFLFMFAVALFVMAIFLIIRLVAVWLLIIVSPLAFFAMAVPDFKKLSSDWWDALFKYSYYGPAAAFFLWLSTKLAFQTIISGNSAFSKDAAATWVVGTILPYLVTLVFLYASIMMAQKFSIQFAAQVTKVADKAIMGFAGAVSGYGAARWTAKKTGEGIKYGAKAGLKKFDRDVMKSWSPRGLIEGWQQRAKEAEQRHLDISSGAWRDTFHRQIDGKETNYERLARDRNIAKKMKEISESSEDSNVLGNKIVDLQGQKTDEAREELSAMFRILWKNKDQNDMLKFIRAQIQDPNSKGGAYFSDLGFDLNNTTVSRENANGAVKKLLSAAGADGDYITKEWLDTGMIGAGNGGIGYGDTEVDPNTGKIIPVTTQGKAAYTAIGKLMTTGEAQDIPKRFHKNHFSNEFGGLNEEGKVALRKYVSPVAIKHSGRHKSDFYNVVAKDASVANEMYAYAAQLGQGTAMGYNDATQQYEQLAVDQNQAKLAAAWTVAIQQKAGVSAADISASLAAHSFNEAEIMKTIADAKLMV